MEMFSRRFALIVRLLPRLSLVTILLVAPTALTAEDWERKTDLEDQVSVAVTVYNNNLGLVREIRDVTLGRGVGSLLFEGVSAQINPKTVALRSLTVGGAVC